MEILYDEKNKEIQEKAKETCLKRYLEGDLYQTYSDQISRTFEVNSF